MLESWVLIEDGRIVDGRETERLVPWWSFGKTVLAAAALVLVRDGFVALDEPLDGKPYTLRHLLQHRAGLVDYGGSAAYHTAVARGDDPWPVPLLLQHVDAERLRYATGEGWAYSNIGYLFVKQLIETLTGESLDGALRRLVFRPLGIDGARVATGRADLESVEMGDARGYHPGWVYHGLLVGTVQDAAELQDSLMAGRLLPPQLFADMMTPFVLSGPIPERPWLVPGYGLGAMVGEKSGGGKVGGHTGGGPGSTIAVYHGLQGHPRRTAAFFTTDEDQARSEKEAFRLLT